MGLKLNTASSGSVTLEPANTASNYTLTVPAQTGTIAINGPAFSATANTSTTLSNATWTKILFESEEFDTNNNFASSRFTPTIAGYYQIIIGFLPPTASRTGEVQLAIYKNGTIYKSSFDQTATSTYIGGMSCLVYCNGSTDYVEGYAYCATGGTTGSSSVYTYLQGYMARAA